MRKNFKVLLCEDDENIGLLLREYLQMKDYKVDLYADGEAGYKGFVTNRYDLCILNMIMPKKDGISLLKDIRTVNPDIPVILLIKNGCTDIKEVFSAGADDYMTKPFSMQELVLRIDTILCQAPAPVPKGNKQMVYQFGNTVFNTQSHILSIKGQDIKLTNKEGALLSLLCFHANNILERSEALSLIWGVDTVFKARTMDVYITKLRKLLKDDPDIAIINVHGKGHKLSSKQI
ncbi:MAG: response regulator transcription factor [Dysgonomonas sp.]